MIHNDKLTITIFGDICPVKDTLSGFKSGKPDTIIGKNLLALMQQSDLVIGNLECALTDNPAPIKKAGPVLYAPTKCVDTIARAGFTALSMANNHCRDCGTAGLRSTAEACKTAGLATFGAGDTPTEAKQPLIINCKGRKIAFMAFAESEFNHATDTRAGAATLDVYNDFEYIRQVRDKADLLIVLYHGGIEHHPYPSPELQKKCRKIAASGADVVLCQHSHCIGTYERFDNSFILYGQGNNLFGYRNNSPEWNNGLLAQITVQDSIPQIKLIPCATNPQSIFEQLPDVEARELLNEIRTMSAKIQDTDFIASQWLKFCLKNENLNLPLLLGWNRYMIFLNRKLGGWPVRFLYGRHKKNIIHNLIRCEAHNEVMNTILSNYDYE